MTAGLPDDPAYCFYPAVATRPPVAAGGAGPTEGRSVAVRPRSRRHGVRPGGGESPPCGAPGRQRSGRGGPT